MLICHFAVPHSDESSARSGSGTKGKAETSAMSRSGTKGKALSDKDSALNNNNHNNKRPLEESPSQKQPAPPDVQPSKRSRVSRACDQCRASREKCDGVQPACQTCESQKRKCSYFEQPKKRGIQPNYIRTLELTLAWLFSSYPAAAFGLAKSLSSPEDAASRIIGNKDSSAAEKLHSHWRDSLPCKQIDQLLSGQPVDAKIAALSPPPQPSPSTLSQLDGRQSGTFPTETMGRQYVLPDNTWSLLDHYYLYTHSWLPICEKSTVLKTIYAYPPSGLREHECTRGEHAELWSILALAQAQIGALETDDQGYGVVRVLARHLIPSERGPFEAGHIRALLLLGLIESMNQRWLPASMLNGNAIRLLLSLYPPGSNESVDLSGRLKHTFLAACILEEALPGRLYLDLNLTRYVAGEVGFIDEDGLEEWAPWQEPSAAGQANAVRSPARSISCFNSLAQRALYHSNTRNPDGDSRRPEKHMVAALLSNARRKMGRVQPSVLVSHLLQSANSNALATGHSSKHPTSTGAQELASTAAITEQDQWPPSLQAHNQHAISVPNEEHTSSIYPSLGMPGGSDLGSSVTHEDLPNTRAVATGPTEHRANFDIFDQLAMLESPDDGNFMQNLGFGPDLDLQEFFGADYQPSDPLLS